jgi:sugar diacid utilization regulator
VAATVACVQDVVPIEVDVCDAGFHAGMVAAIGAALDEGLATIEQRPGWAFALAPQAADRARAAARLGVSCTAELRRYMTGHRRLGEFIAEEVDDLALADPAGVLLHVRRTLELAMERLAAALEEVYEQELRRRDSPHSDRRVELVRRLLAGEVSSPSAAEHLSYDLGGWHLAVIVLTAGRDDALTPLAAHGRLLRVRPDEDTAWGWLALRERPAETAIERICASFARDASVALGEPGRGLEGWRRSHEQAQAALQALLLRPRRHVRYADVALLAPWLARPDHGRSLVDLYLAPLCSLRDGGAAARATMRAWFEADRNISAAALRLGVDRRTVAYRLRTIEDVIGHPLERRMAELEVTLRVQELLDQ